jgi:PTH1 family peptidyl-tRNA hydrolase
MTEKIISGQKVILVKPITMMNLSGDSVRLIADFYKIKPADITVIYDEIDLDFGVVKKKVGGEGKSSHNGLKSISLALKSNDYNRIRFGINSNTPIKKRADFVLARFTKDEELELDKLTKLALELI